MKPILRIIHVVDDDPSFRKAVTRLLRASGYDVVSYESAYHFLENMPDLEPACILLDMKMPILGGLQLQERLLQRGFKSAIIFLTGHGDIPTSVQAIKAGAEDYLTKPVSKATLIETIERAFARYADRREQQDRLVELQNLVSTLTERESEVFSLVVRGKLNKQIAHELGTSERTIKAHRHSIMQKLHVNSVAEAVSIAERIGILPDPSDRRSEVS